MKTPETFAAWSFSAGVKQSFRAVFLSQWAAIAVVTWGEGDSRRKQANRRNSLFRRGLRRKACKPVARRRDRSRSAAVKLIDAAGGVIRVRTYILAGHRDGGALQFEQLAAARVLRRVTCQPTREHLV